jgi:hypothetical protein
LTRGPASLSEGEVEAGCRIKSGMTKGVYVEQITPPQGD